MPHSKVKVTRENTTNVLALWCEKKYISIWPTRNHSQHQKTICNEVGPNTQHRSPVRDDGTIQYSPIMSHAKNDTISGISRLTD